MSPCKTIPKYCLLLKASFFFLNRKWISSFSLSWFGGEWWPGRVLDRFVRVTAWIKRYSIMTGILNLSDCIFPISITFSFLSLPYKDWSFDCCSLWHRFSLGVFGSALLNSIDYHPWFMTWIWLFWKCLLSVHFKNLNAVLYRTLNLM